MGSRDKEYFIITTFFLGWESKKDFEYFIPENEKLLTEIEIVFLPIIESIGKNIRSFENPLQNFKAYMK